MPVYIFTFGSGHFGANEVPLADRFVRVFADSESDARAQVMSVRGQAFAFSYPSEEAAGVKKHQLEEIPLYQTIPMRPTSPRDESDEKAQINAYRDAVLAAYFSANRLAAHDIHKLLADIERAESIGPIVDPTFFREKMKAMEEDKAVLRAAIPLWNIGKKLAAEREARRGTMSTETGGA